MGTQFDHSQYITDVRLALGESTGDIKQRSPFTDQEYLRGIVDPGFGGSIRLLVGDLSFEGGVTSSLSVTWKWQARKVGVSSWVDLHTAVTETWGTASDTGKRVVLEAAALGSNANQVPLEVRLIVTASGTDNIWVRTGGANPVPAVRVFGESL